MSQLALLLPTTAASSGTTLPILETCNYQYVTFSAPGLATSETVSVSIQFPDGQASVPAMDINGVNTGLSATNQTRNYLAGPNYVLVKSSTAASVGVYVDLGGRVL